MKKKLLMVVAALMLLVPTIVFADGASYVSVNYEVMVNVKEGLVLVPSDYEDYDNTCFEEDECNQAYENDDMGYDSEEGSTSSKLITLKYGTKLNIIYEEDSDLCFEYGKGKIYCTSAYNLIGTKVNIKDYKDDKLDKPYTIEVLKEITLYEGPGEVFKEIPTKIKPGDSTKITHYTDSFWFYVEGPNCEGWMYEDSLMEYTDEDESEESTFIIKGYIKEDYDFIVYGNNALIYDKDGKEVDEKIYSGTIIKSIGVIYGDTYSYVYYNNQNELRIVLLEEDEIGYELNGVYLYVNNNADVKMYEVNNYNTPIDSTKILKNKTFYNVKEYVHNEEINYYLIRVNDKKYIVEITHEYLYNRLLMPEKNYGAVAVIDELLTSKMTYGLLITANNTPAYLSPDSKSKVVETIEKDTTILPLAFQYNASKKDYYILAYNYGWIKVEDNTFKSNPDADPEEFEECGSSDYCGESVYYDLNPYELSIYEESEGEFFTVYQTETHYSDDSEDGTKETIPDNDWKKVMAVFGNKNHQDYDENATSDIEELMNNYRIKPYEEYDDGDYYDDEDYDSDDDDDDDWDESEENNEALGEASALKDLRDAKLSKQRANEKNKPTQAIAREQKNNKFDIIIPLLTAFAIAVLVSAVIVVLLIAAHKKKKLEETQKLEALKPEEPASGEPTPVEEPKEEAPAEEASSEVPKEESTPVEETPSETPEEVTPEEPKEEVPAEEPKEGTSEEPKEEN